MEFVKVNISFIQSYLVSDSLRCILKTLQTDLEKMSVQGDEEEKATPIPDLKNLLIECEVGNGKGSKVVDSKILKRAADTVKAYLKSDPGKVDDLLECDEFAGFLVQCLKQGENK